MKKTVALILVLVLALGMMSACGKKSAEKAEKEEAPQTTYKECEVALSYEGATYKAKASLPELGALEEEQDEVEGEGGNFISIYSRENDAVYAVVELHLSIVTKEFKQKTVAGTREATEREMKAMKIGGYEAYMNDCPENGDRCRQYYLYTTDSKQNIVELYIFLQDSFNDLTEDEWKEICTAVESNVSFAV